MQFLGTAPEGKSFARSEAGSFMFSDPTPGARNVFSELAAVAQSFPLDRPLNPSLGAPEVFGIALGGAATLAMIILVVVKKNENLSNLFFKRNA
jgi:hypothetical protein